MPYDDGDKERIKRGDETWQYNDSAATGNSSAVTTKSFDIDNKPHDLRRMLNHFGNKSAITHQAQGFGSMLWPKHMKLRKKLS